MIFFYLPALGAIHFVSAAALEPMSRKAVQGTLAERIRYGTKGPPTPPMEPHPAERYSPSAIDPGVGPGRDPHSVRADADKPVAPHQFKFRWQRVARSSIINGGDACAAADWNRRLVDT